MAVDATPGRLTAPLAALLGLLALPLPAEERACVTRVDHLDIVIAPGAIPAEGEAGLGERLLSFPRGVWNRAWGRPAVCDSSTTIAFLAGVLALSEVDRHCLARAPGDGGWLLIPGERNFRGRCRRTFCDRVNATAEDAAGLGRLVALLATGQDPGAAAGLTAAVGASGSAMVSGEAGTIIGALGEAATALTAALAAPEAAAAAAVTAIAVGGTVYLCHD